MTLSFVDILIFIIGTAGIVLWIYVIFCVFYKQILVDRILARAKYKHSLLIFLLIVIMPFSITSVAMLCDLKPYDLLYNTSLYNGEERDYDLKMGYRQDLQKQLLEESEDPSLLGTVFYQFRGIGGQYSAGTLKGREWSLFIGILGTLLFSGLLIPSVLSIIQIRTKRFSYGQVRYKIQRSKYAVIIGGNDIVPELIHQILSPVRKNKIDYVIVQTIDNVNYYRMNLKCALSADEEWHTVLYYGTRNTLKDMKGLHLERASEVYILGEKPYYESSNEHDALNMQCIRNIAEVLKDKKRKERLQCYVLFEYQSTLASFQYSDVSQKVKEQIEFIPLNFYNQWARNVLLNQLKDDKGQKAINYQPLEGQEIINGESEKHVHLVVFGLTEMGKALAIQAAHLAHFPNFNTKGIRSRITIIDPSASTKKEELLRQHSDYFSLARWRVVDVNKEETWESEWTDKLNEAAQLKREGKEVSEAEFPYAHLSKPERQDNNFIDVEWEFVNGNIENEATNHYLNHLATDQNAILTIAACQNDSHEALSSAMYLSRQVYRKAIQVLVHQHTSDDIVQSLAGTGLSDEARSLMRYQHVRPFGMLNHCFPNSIVDYRLAKLVNYVYWRTEDTELKGINQIDASTNLPNYESFWRQCAVVDQWSSEYNANGIATKIRMLGLDFDHTSTEEMKQLLSQKEVMETLIKVEHNRWNTEKLLAGFRPVYGDEWHEVEQLLDAEHVKEYNALKKRLKKSSEMAHLDICSFEDLEYIDNPSIEYDEVLVRAFPGIVNRYREFVTT